MASKTQKNIVLFALFIVPLLFYIFLQLGTHNFGKLPIQTKKVIDISEINTDYTFKNKVSVVVFLGHNFDPIQGELFNLNEKIYKKFYGYTNFQLLIVVPQGSQSAVAQLTKKIAPFTNMVKWNYVFASPQVISSLHESFGAVLPLDANSHSSQAYIIDKQSALRRGKTSDKKYPNKLGYNMQSVGELKKEMHDDVKVLLAEYSFALKKNGDSSSRRERLLKNEKN